MPKKVYNNVEDQRLLDGGKVVEDVTTVALPNITHTTTSLQNISGMVGDVDMPNDAHVEAMELSVNHNNGVNCKLLEEPGVHNIELRVARQCYNVALGVNEHKSVKYRLRCRYKSVEPGNSEKGNPLGYTVKFSVLRFEEEIEGQITKLIDIMGGVIQYNDNNFTDSIESLLA